MGHFDVKPESLGRSMCQQLTDRIDSMSWDSFSEIDFLSFFWTGGSLEMGPRSRHQNYIWMFCLSVCIILQSFAMTFLSIWCSWPEEFHLPPQGQILMFGIWVFPKIGGNPQNGWFIMETPKPLLTFMIWGAKTSIFGLTPISRSLLFLVKPALQDCAKLKMLDLGLASRFKRSHLAEFVCWILCILMHFCRYLQHVRYWYDLVLATRKFWGMTACKHRLPNLQAGKRSVAQVHTWHQRCGMLCLNVSSALAWSFFDLSEHQVVMVYSLFLPCAQVLMYSSIAVHVSLHKPELLM